VIILDISDIRKPTKISQIKWSPPEEGNTHSIGIVVPQHGGRPTSSSPPTNYFAKQCPFGYLHVIDVRHEPNPVQIGTFRLPLNRFCRPTGRGGASVFTTSSAWSKEHRLQRLGKFWVWAIDISDPYRPNRLAILSRRFFAA